MKSERYNQNSVQAVLDRLDGQTFLKELGINSGDYVNGDGEIKSYCPICHDRSKMTFVIDDETRRAHCTNLKCAGSNLNTDQGNLLELYALATENDLDSAIGDLSKSLELKLETSNSEVKPAAGEGGEFTFVEIGRYEYESEENHELVPAPFEFDGQKALGRGLFIPLAGVDRFSASYKRETFRSHFCYNLDDPQKIKSLAGQGKLPVRGDFYVVFDATSSAEIVHAINQAIDLVERLKQNYDVPYDAVSVFYTNRNIEVHIDEGVFAAEPTAGLEEIYRRMLCAIIGLDPHKPEQSSAFSQVNLSVYHYDYLTNIPATIVGAASRDIYKIRMSYSAFKRMSYQRLHEFSLRRPDLPPREPWRQRSPKAADFFNTIRSSMERDTRLDERDTIASLYYSGQEGEGGLATLKQLAPTLLRRLFDESRVILQSPSEQLNDTLAGGFYPGHLYVLAGQPGAGTSSFALQILNHIAANQDTHCLFVGLQRGVEEVFKRSLSFLGKITVHEIDAKRQHPQELHDDKDFNRRIFAAYERYQQFANSITILEGAAAGSIQRIVQLIREKRELMVAQGAKASSVILVIDSLQMMVGMMRSLWVEQTLGQEFSPARELARWDVESLTSRLKAIARELDIAVIATHELYDGCNSVTSSRAAIEPAVQQLYNDTQFADTVMVLCRQGAGLHNLRDYFRAEYSGTPLESQVAEIEKSLTKLETDYRQTQEFSNMRSEFTILDVIKNRSGTLNKILFVYHKPYSYFEPVSYI